jgi:hypothetical protein
MCSRERLVAGRICWLETAGALPALQMRTCIGGVVDPYLQG